MFYLFFNTFVNRHQNEICIMQFSKNTGNNVTKMCTKLPTAVNGEYCDSQKKEEHVDE